GEARKEIITNEAKRQQFEGDQVARKTAKALSDKEVADLSRQELLKLGAVNIAERAQKAAQAKYEADKAR
ncbi:hypothetical protein, partial [Escherichia coli]|uniref:hypothetical protein n=1 Tax=Escherichia coli TaxID=562 RepID=UPI001F1C07E3